MVKSPKYFPLKNSEGFFKEKNSKFFSFLYPVHNLDEIDNQLSNLRKKYYDATHVCYAWRLGFEKVLERANDDGEPSYSAGQPILRRLTSAELSNALLAVVRYYGGTKLGVSGLIAAYEEAANLAIEANEKDIFVPKVTFTIEFKIEDTYLIFNLLNKFNYQVLEENYGEIGKMTIEMEKQNFETIEKKLTEFVANIYL